MAMMEEETSQQPYTSCLDIENVFQDMDLVKQD